MKHFAIILFIFFSHNFLLQGQTYKNQESHQYTIKRSLSDIKVDGIIDEEAWENIEPMGDFWYSFPVDNKPSEKEFQTEVKITFDDAHIYIAAICYGKGPFVMQSLKRDNMQIWEGDVFGVTIDPVNEKTNAYSFATNTAGVQSDVLVGANTGTRTGGGSSGNGFNSAWDNKWVCNSTEYEDRWVTEIAIPFKSLKYGENKDWGINLIRGIPSTNSWHTWAPVPVQLMGLDLGYTGKMIWEEAPPKSKSNISVIPYALASTFTDYEEGLPTENKIRIGGDAKVAITSKLNLDLTLNPDFSQVDVDEQITNLTTVNIRFPERRLFFLENSDIFSEFGIPPMRPFFSRKIGLDEDANPIPILYGARISGNINDNLRIGLSNLQTRTTDEFFAQNYTSFAFNQRIFGRTSVKGYLHNRQAFIDSEFSKIDYNRALGGEIEYRSLDGKWRANSGGGLTLSNGIIDKNYTYHGIISYDDRNISLYANLMAVGDNYIPDMGFMTLIYHYDAVTEETHRIGYGHFFNRGAYTFYPKHGFIINHGFNYRFLIDYAENNKEIFIRSFEPGYKVSFNNTSNIEVKYTNNYNQLFYPFAFTDFEPLPAGDYNSSYVGLTYQSDTRKQLSYLLGFETGSFYGGKRIQYSAEISFRQKPWGNFGLRLIQNELEFAQPYGSTSLTLIGPKLEFNFSRNLSWTSFLQYNTQNDNFNINSRVQWQFKSLSNIYLVYSENYAIEQWGPKNKALILKANYWINI